MNKFVYRYFLYLSLYSLVAFGGWQLGTLLGSHAISFMLSVWFGIGLCYLEQHCDLRPRPLRTSDWGKLMWLGLFWPLVIQPDVVMEERGPHIDA
ncbi:hypothetical protein [Aestuariirhabdus litorea]|uniref:Uncharacterized protein n=1 Tax=Aestuariirhabdus litorea TaxID=2528527 RepID=A0A3P3VM90_9GAMM|nr:hypothetical protein [Aestuariirhabdus litorea]RRJ83882.1 hypothetical protein D0544_01825 [Aestuariirhabdus litorea]RWW97104.1 hypothetical protein DZC74_01825 [Endozoicomonadaceae bacterium GTF-13]